MEIYDICIGRKGGQCLGRRNVQTLPPLGWLMIACACTRAVRFAILPDLPGLGYPLSAGHGSVSFAGAGSSQLAPFHQVVTEAVLAERLTGAAEGLAMTVSRESGFQGMVPRGGIEPPTP